MAMLKKEEVPEIFREPILYREWSHWLTATGRHRMAIEYFKKVSKLIPDAELRTLVGHCKALLKNVKYLEAEKMAQKCMLVDPDHYKTREMRMKALFHIGEFGHSLADAYVGVRRHRMTFEHGIYQAIETIENCIGQNTSPIAMLLLYPWIQELAEHRQLLMEKLKEKEEDEFEGIENDEDTKFKVNDLEMQRQGQVKKLHRVIAKMYTGLLAIDKDFFSEILRHPEIVSSPNKKTTMKLIGLATSCYRNLKCMQNRLRMRRPIYVTLFQRRDIPKGHKMMIEQQKQLRKNIIIIEANFLLRYLHNARINKDYCAFFGFVERTKYKFDSYSSRMFPLKQKCLNTVYKMVACVYLDTRNLMCMDEEIQMRYFKHILGIREALLPRDVDLAWMPVPPNPDETLKIFRRKLAAASQPLELAWLHHEFCKFLIDIDRFDLARFYAKKGVDFARKAACNEWVLNIEHLLLRIEIHQSNRNEAREAAVVALECAKLLDIDYLINFYEKAMEVLELELDVEWISDFNGIASRKSVILDLMPPELKDETEFLWRRMDVVPARRRLSIMPGCKPVDKKFEMPSKRSSILPSLPRDSEIEARHILLREHAPIIRGVGFVDFAEFD